MLAGLVKNPTGLDPTNSPDAARERRNVVLDRMAQLDVITPKQAGKTKKADLGLDVQPSDNGCVNSRAPFFCDYVINTLMQDPSLGETKDERKQLLRSGGLTIRTTIDLRFQAAADRAVQEYTDPTDQVIGGVAMVEPGTGDGEGDRAVPADGRRPGGGPDLPQLRGAPGGRRRRRLPGRAPRSRRSCSPRR